MESTKNTQKKIVTLTTDFGLSDEYVGVMKGMILKHCLDVTIVDITHDIPPQNIAVAARTLAASYNYFPQGTIHLAVVDPGVGTEREIILLEMEDYSFIAPDNGLLTPFLTQQPKATKCYKIFKKENISHTFHGRDVMAPLAGQLSAGISPQNIGKLCNTEDCTTISLPGYSKSGNTITGEVVSIDHFGNISTSIPASALTHFVNDVKIQINAFSIHAIQKTYGNSQKSEFLALIDSRGFLEIAKNCGNAAESICCAIGEKVIVEEIHS